MYPRIVRRKNKNGNVVEYTQLCENKRNREKKCSKVKIVKEEIGKLHAVEYKTREGVTIIQRTQLTNKQKKIFNKLSIRLPNMYLYIGSKGHQ